jgi:phospholipid N-methyltransferase
MLAKFLKSPRTIGCLTPSSTSLARAMAGMISPNCSDRVVELGSGTGSITSQILMRLPSASLLTCLEIDQQMCSQFRNSFPGIDLMERDCREIGSIFAGQKIANIVSSLPYRSLPRATSDSIFEQKIALSNSQTVISLFTYDSVFSKYHQRYPIELLDYHYVFLNFPPAIVYHYTL